MYNVKMQIRAGEISCFLEDKITYLAKKSYRKVTMYTKRALYPFRKNVYFSIGENCLSDNILSRYGLKTFSSPYASARSNIEYILAFEKENYTDFLNDKYLLYDESFGSLKIPQNKKYVKVDNKYNRYCTKGFEFTHHDVLGKSGKKKEINRRCNRIRKLSGKNLGLLYHHQYCEQTDMSLLIKHLQMLADLYQARNNKVNIYLFYQVLVSSDSQRKVECHKENNIHIYAFHTTKEWDGREPGTQWAQRDEDLIRIMIEDIKRDQ